MDLELRDKVILVTGGSKGIGNAICQVLAKEGAIPFIVGRNEENVNNAVRVIEENDGKAAYAIAELTDPQQCESAVKTAIEKFERIDGLVNNAGVNDGIGLENGNAHSFVESLKKNVVHYYLMAHHALPELKKSKGAIVNIGSKTATTGQGGTSVYATANSGRDALTREWH